MNRPAAAFSDAEQLWNLAVEHGGLRYRVTTYGAAVNMRQNLYRFRTKQEKMLAAQLGAIPGADLSTPYSGFKISIFDGSGANVGSRKKKEDPEWPPYELVFELPLLDGEILDLEGNAIELPAAPEAQPLGLDQEDAE